MEQKCATNSPEQKDIVRRLSHTVLHATKRKRQSLFDHLTRRNRARIEALLQEQPIFYNETQDAPLRIQVDENIHAALPPAFFSNPTRWIESQPNVKRDVEEAKTPLPTGQNIAEIRKFAYDRSKVKEFTLKDGAQEITVISKRVQQEVMHADLAYEKGIPTPKVLGLVQDHGNIYAFFEKIEGINLNSAFIKFRSLHNSDALPLPPSPENLPTEWQEKHPFFKEVEQKIYEWWKKFKSITLIHYILKIFSDRIFLNNEEFDEFLSETISHYSEEEVQKALELVGYTIDKFKEHAERNYPFLDKYTDGLQESSAEEKSADERWTKETEKWRTNIAPQLKHLEDSLGAHNKEGRRIAAIAFFGFDPFKEKNKLHKHCKDKDIEHKDYFNRNIIIPWDSENDRPKDTPEGQPKLYLIDWDPRPKPKQPSKAFD